MLGDLEAAPPAATARTRSARVRGETAAQSRLLKCCSEPFFAGRDRHGCLIQETAHVVRQTRTRRARSRARSSVRLRERGRLGLRADCGSCFGLCCVALAFAASADFAIDKAAGQPCPNLRADFRCGIHTRPPAAGLSPAAPSTTASAPGRRSPRSPSAARTGGRPRAPPGRCSRCSRSCGSCTSCSGT